MTLEGTKAEFTLRGFNPDVLTCIANLSNDEVFTPPVLANQMLDGLELAWAEANMGKSIWADPTVKFLDPFSKSGVFLREIVTRLTSGLVDEIPGLQERVDHILTRQVYGIGITTLTSLLARRSVYCSKFANGEFSIAKSFDREWGNIWFERTEHTWAGGSTTFWVDPLTGQEKTVLEGGRCRYCGAPRHLFDRDTDAESHAYAFIHTDDVKTRMAELFGAEMQFDVIIGNPPYQMTGGAGGSSDSSIYHLFVEQAQRLEPRFLSMVIPSRWMAGGRGLDIFRAEMLNSGKIRELVDFPMASEAFPGVEVKGGICYFLWDMAHQGNATVTTVRSGEKLTSRRALDEFDVFVRDPRATEILKKVAAAGEPSMTGILSRDTPFGLPSNFEHFAPVEAPGLVPIYFIRKMKRSIGYVEPREIAKNRELVDTWKLLVPEAYNGGDGLPHQIVGKPVVAPNPSVCTQSYLFFRCNSEAEAKSIQSYYSTRLFRFLVSLRKITQHAIHSTYTWVPLQEWDQVWTDEELYAKYGISGEDREYIESQIRPMKLDDSDADGSI